jgi:hypothetical protein
MLVTTSQNSSLFCRAMTSFIESRFNFLDFLIFLTFRQFQENLKDFLAKLLLDRYLEKNSCKEKIYFSSSKGNGSIQSTVLNCI